VKRTFTINGHGFNRKQVEEQVTKIRDSYEPGERVSEDHEQLLRAVFELSPRRMYYEGSGISHLECEPSENPASKPRLVIVHVDGSRKSFSPRKILSPEKSTQEESVRAAFRHEIGGQMQGPLDAETDRRVDEVLLAGRKDVVADVEFLDIRVEVHHDGKTFAEILSKFLAAECLTIRDVAVSKQETGERLANRELARRWQAFHNANAVLIALGAKQHRAITRVRHQKGQRSTRIFPKSQ
jgi:hypothetical protein